MAARVVELTGQVVSASLDPGSKSARQGVMLNGENGESYILRRHGAPAFGDQGLDDLVGSRILAKGIAIDNVLILREWQSQDD